MQRSVSNLRKQLNRQATWTEEEFFTAGQRAPAGSYANVDAPWRRKVLLEADDILPASLDGRVALYRRLPSLGSVVR